MCHLDVLVHRKPACDEVNREWFHNKKGDSRFSSDYRPVFHLAALKGLRYAMRQQP
jgi:hypothetical protein